jgi:hypothetical protein
VAYALTLASCGEAAAPEAAARLPMRTEEPAQPSLAPAREPDVDEDELAHADAGAPLRVMNDAERDASSWDAPQDAALGLDAGNADASCSAAQPADAAVADASCSACRDAAAHDAGLDASVQDVGLDAARADGAASGSGGREEEDAARAEDASREARVSADAAEDAGLPSDASEPPLGTFTRVYQLMRQRCRGCHVPGAAYSLDLSQKQLAYDELVGGPAMGAAEFIVCSGFGYRRVVPGDPAQSLLWQKLRDVQPCGDQMPPGSSLDVALANEVEAWIATGAWND